MARILVLVSEYHRTITDNLKDGALRAIAAQNLPSDVVYVPGAFELGVTAAAAAESGKWAAIVCLGCVITGETRHNEYINSAVSNGFLEISLRTKIPVHFGVLTPDTWEQAVARSQPIDSNPQSAGSKTVVSNKGFEAASAAIKTLESLELIRNL